MPGSRHREGDGAVLRRVEEDDLRFRWDAINGTSVRRHRLTRPLLNHLFWTADGSAVLRGVPTFRLVAFSDRGDVDQDLDAVPDAEWRETW